MAVSSKTSIRCGLVGVFALLLAGLLVPTASAQFPRPGFPPQPPFGPPNFPQIPPPPRFPDFPGPGGMGGPGRLGGIGMGGPTIEHTCGKCRAVMACNDSILGFTGTCPGCGLRYTGGTAFDDGRNRPNPGGFAPQPNMGGPGMPQPPAFPQPPGAFNPNPVPPQPAGGQNQIGALMLPAVNADSDGAGSGPAAEPATPTPAVSNPTANVTPPKSSNRALYIIGGVIFGLLVILGLIIAIMYVQANQKKSRVAPRRRLRREVD